MSPHLKLLCFAILNTILHLTRPTASRCLVVYLSINTTIDPTLNATDWEGTYSYAGFETDGCLAYSASNGQTLRYYGGSWSLATSTNDLLSYETASSGTPCDPPLGDDLPWKHGEITSDTLITTKCSQTSSPTSEPTLEPTPRPTSNPITSAPSAHPSLQPSVSPTDIPTSHPSAPPSAQPTANPSATPSIAPTKPPTSQPSVPPTQSPTNVPVIPPTRAPTDACSRIEVFIKSPAAVMPSPVDGVYYIQPNPWPPGQYPWYMQQFSGTDHENPLPTNHGVIYWDAGFWNIVVSTGVHLQYQRAMPLPTAYTPPHTAFTGNGWEDVSKPDGITWTVQMDCGQVTVAPTTFPTTEPTHVPSEQPTVEPTVQPTQAQPSFFPTQEPIVTSEAETASGEEKVASFLDTFSVLEWLILASLPLIVLLICGSLYIWRANKIEAAQKEHKWHQPSAVRGDLQDEVEMIASEQKKQKPKQLQFVVASPNSEKRPSALKARFSGGGDHTPVKSYKDVNVAADFSNALKVVGSHKSKRSMDQDEVDYQEVRAAEEEVEPNTNDATEMMTFDEEENAEPAVSKQDSEFYGNHPIDEIYSYTFVTKPFGMEWKTLKKDKKNLYVSKITAKSQAELGKIEIGSKLISFNGEMVEDLGAKKIYAKLAITDMPLTITFLKPHKKEQDKEGDNYKSGGKTASPPPAAVVDAEAAPIANSPPAPPAQIHAPPSPVPPDNRLSGGDKPLIPPKAPSVDQEYASGVADVNPTDEPDPFAEMPPNPAAEHAVPSEDEEDYEYEEEEEEPPEIKHQPTEAMMKQAQALIPEVFDDEDAPQPFQAED